MRLLLIALTVLTLISCSKGGDDRLAEQEGIRVQEQMKAQNDNQRNWAEKMERDLNERKYFIKAVEGIFNGVLTVNDIDFDLKAEITPSMPISFSDRVRTLDEINYELENLTITIHIKMQNPRVPNSAVSCTIESIRPNTEKGLIPMISESCKNIFKLRLSDTLDQSDFTTMSNRARTLARSIVRNELSQIDILSGLFESSVSTTEYKFKLKRN